MKRDMDKLNLRDAFTQEPDFCHEALMHAARSVKEEKQVKRVSFRAVIIAAMIIAAMTAVAFAAGSLLGWTDFYGQYSTVGVPQSAVDEMQVTDDLTWQVGPLTFTAKELLTDGHIAISSIHIYTTDGSEALLTSDPWGTIGASGEDGEAMAEKLGVEPKTTWITAANKLNLPLYNVRGILDIAPEYSHGESMEDPMWNEDGSIVYFSMPALKPKNVQDKLDAGLFLRAAKIDPATGNETDLWVNRDEVVSIPVSKVLEERTYQPVETAEVMGCRLEKISAQRYVTGAYLTLTFTADENADQEQAYALYDLITTDDQGTELPHGMNLSGSIDTAGWPQINLVTMIGVDELPDSIIVTDGDVKIVTK